VSDEEADACDKLSAHVALANGTGMVVTGRFQKHGANNPPRRSCACLGEPGKPGYCAQETRIDPIKILSSPRYMTDSMSCVDH
jgi:hypothetical protein